jgi:hypothetical protein
VVTAFENLFAEIQVENSADNNGLEAFCQNRPQIMRANMRDGRLFPWSKDTYAGSQELYGLWRAACTAGGVIIPEKVAFHVLCHSYGAWMRIYGEADTSDLIATGRWSSREAAAGYEHVQVTTAHRLADKMPRRRA